MTIAGPDPSLQPSSGSNRIEFLIVEGPEQGRVLVVDQPDCALFGRAPDAQIRIPEDPYVSAHHFLLEVCPPSCKLSDLGSKNGSVVNGVRYGGRRAAEPGVSQAPEGVRSVWLRHGDEVQVGRTKIRVVIRAAAPETPPSVRAAPATLAVCIKCGGSVSRAGGQVREAGEEWVCKPCVETNKAVLLNRDALRQALYGSGAKSDTEFPGYQVERKLGQGGMGAVYLATETATGRTVAIKSILPHLAASHDTLQRFRREATILRALSHARHPNLVQLLDFGGDESRFYFVMEFVEGPDLAQLARDAGGRLELEAAAPLMLGILDGLSLAHRARVQLAPGEVVRGIVHRDLKPQNVLVKQTPDGLCPKVADFGLAKALQVAGLTTLTRSGQWGGTPLYWPREQVTNFRVLSAASDVFSVAAMFYELLTGRLIREGFDKLLQNQPPLRRPGVLELMRVVVGSKVRPIASLDPTLPGAVARVIDQALTEADAASQFGADQALLGSLRFPDAGVFRDALAAALDEAGITPDDRRLSQHRL